MHALFVGPHHQTFEPAKQKKFIVNPPDQSGQASFKAHSMLHSGVLFWAVC